VALRYLTKHVAADFRSLDEQATQPITQSGLQGWISFCVTEISEEACTDAAIMLLKTDSLGKTHKLIHRLPPIEGPSEGHYEVIEV
jgi:hypothetical protein